MARRSQSLAVVEDPEPQLPIPKERLNIRDAYARVKAAAIEDYNNARQQQIANRTTFEAQYGRIDKVDQSFLDQVNAMMIRASAIVAANSKNYGAAPKIAKIVPLLAALGAEITMELARDKTIEMFAQVEERDFLGHFNSRSVIPSDPSDWVGEKATGARSLFDVIEIVDDTPATTAAAGGKKIDKEDCGHGARRVYDEDDMSGIEDHNGNEVALIVAQCVLCGDEVAEFEGEWQSAEAIEAILVEREQTEADAQDDPPEPVETVDDGEDPDDEA